jgi:hypothetical protein
MDASCVCKYNMKTWKYNWVTDTISYVPKPQSIQYHNLLYRVEDDDGWQYIYNGRFVKIDCPKCVHKANKLKIGILKSNI